MKYLFLLLFSFLLIGCDHPQVIPKQDYSAAIGDAKQEQADVKKAQVIVDQLHPKNAATAAKLDQIKAALDEALQEDAALQKQLDALQKENAALTSQANADIQKYADQVATLQKQIDALNKQATHEKVLGAILIAVGAFGYFLGVLLPGLYAPLLIIPSFLRGWAGFLLAEAIYGIVVLIDGIFGFLFHLF